MKIELGKVYRYTIIKSIFDEDPHWKSRVGRVVRKGKDIILICNPEVLTHEEISGDLFKWGTWLDPNDITLEEVE